MFFFNEMFTSKFYYVIILKFMLSEIWVYLMNKMYVAFVLRN